MWRFLRSRFMGNRSARQSQPPRARATSSITSDQASEVDQLLAAHQLIPAIRAVRGYTGWGLKQAKDFVDARRDELSRRGLEPIPVTPPPAAVDESIRHRITFVDQRTLASATETLRAIERLLFGTNYQITLDLKAVDLPTDELPAVEVMSACYPESKPDPTAVRRVSLDELRQDVEGCFRYEGDTGSGPQFTAERREELDRELLPAYWNELSKLVAMQAAAVYAYNDETGLPGYYTFWFFAYLIHAGRRGVVVIGKASD